VSCPTQACRPSGSKADGNSWAVGSRVAHSSALPRTSFRQYIWELRKDLDNRVASKSAAIRSQDMCRVDSTLAGHNWDHSRVTCRDSSRVAGKLWGRRACSTRESRCRRGRRARTKGEAER